MSEFTYEQLEQKVIDLLADNEHLAHSNKMLRQALREVAEFDSRSMYERCPDCDYESECRTTKTCKAVPQSKIGKIALKALGPNAVLSGASTGANCCD